MKKCLKYFAAVLLMAGVIAGSIVLPPALSDYNTQQMVGKVQFDNAADVNVYRYKLSEAEKLELIARKNSDSSEILWSYNKFGPSSSELTEAEAMETCVNEMQKLCENLFSEDWAGITEKANEEAVDNNLQQELITVYDVRNPGKNLSIWTLTFLLGYQFYSFDIDAETGRILGFSIPSLLPEKAQLKAAEIVEAFAGYLGYSTVHKESSMNHITSATVVDAAFYSLGENDLCIVSNWNEYNFTIELQVNPDT